MNDLEREKKREFFPPETLSSEACDSWRFFFEEKLFPEEFENL